MYRHWKQDPKSVHASWATYFSGLDKGIPSSSAFAPPPGFIGAASGVPQPADGSPQMDLQGGGDVTDYLKVSRGDCKNKTDGRSNSSSVLTRSEDTTLPTSTLSTSPTPTWTREHPPS